VEPIGFSMMQVNATLDSSDRGLEQVGWQGLAWWLGRVFLGKAKPWNSPRQPAPVPKEPRRSPSKFSPPAMHNILPSSSSSSSSSSWHPTIRPRALMWPGGATSASASAGASASACASTSASVKPSRVSVLKHHLRQKNQGSCIGKGLRANSPNRWTATADLESIHPHFLSNSYPCFALTVSGPIATPSQQRLSYQWISLGLIWLATRLCTIQPPLALFLTSPIPSELVALQSQFSGA
jgi:hypothetical protein